MPEPIKPNSRIQDTKKQGQRVADRMATNINKSTPPEDILSIVDSIDTLEKQAMSAGEIKYTKDMQRADAITGHSTVSPGNMYPEYGVSEMHGNQTVPASMRRTKSLTPSQWSKVEMKQPKYKAIVPANIQNSLNMFEKQLEKFEAEERKANVIAGQKTEDISIHPRLAAGTWEREYLKSGATGIPTKTGTIPQPKAMTLRTVESHYIPDKKVEKISSEEYELRLNPHTRTGGTPSTIKYPKISREAIMQNSEIVNKEIKNIGGREVVPYKYHLEDAPIVDTSTHAFFPQRTKQAADEIVSRYSTIPLKITMHEGIQNSEAIMQNSTIINKEVMNPFAVATAKAKEMGYDDFSEGSEGAKKRSEIAEAIKKKEHIPISKAVLLCKLEKQIFQLENGGIPDDYILKAYGTFDSIPEELQKQENRPPIGWFEKALENIIKSDYSGNAHRYCVELWKSSDGADELLHKTMGVSSVKPLDNDELYKRDRLVDTAAEGGEAEEVRGDGTKVHTTDIAPIKITSTN